MCHCEPLGSSFCQLWNYAVETDLINNSNCRYDHKCNSDSRSSSNSCTVWGRQEEPRKSSRRRVQKTPAFLPIRSPFRKQSTRRRSAAASALSSRRSSHPRPAKHRPRSPPLSTSSLPDGGLGTYRNISYLPST